MKALKWVGDRLREPSTYAGLATILSTMLHAKYATVEAGILANVGMALGGVIAIIMAEKGSK